MIDLQLSKKLFNDIYFDWMFDYTSHRYSVLGGGAGSGKSVAICQKILIKCLNDKRKVLVIRKTLTSQKDSCGRLFLEILSQGRIKEYCTIRITDYSIELPNGSIILFKGMEDTERIKSIVGITDLGCEECTELAEEEFDQLNLRLRANVNDSEIYASFNPISKANGVYNRGFKDEPDDNTFILKTTYKDNKFLPADYIKSLEGMVDTNPTYYKIYALGEFCSLDKLVYTNGKVEEFNHNDIPGELICGLDFGFVNDNTAFIASIADGNKLYIFNEYICKNKTNDQIADAIKALGFSKSNIIADSAEPKSVAELKKYGIYRVKESVKGPDSIIHGIQKLQQYEIIVHPSCTETITELENYSWQKDRQSGEYINKPIDMFNHCLDAIRYSLQCLDVQKLITFDKSILGL